MSSIRITSTPPGFPPQEIREQWIGVEIPLPSSEEIAEDPPSAMGTVVENAGGHHVLTFRAIQALRDAQKPAFKYWERVGMGRFLRFSKDCCELVE